VKPESAAGLKNWRIQQLGDELLVPRGETVKVRDAGCIPNRPQETLYEWVKSAITIGKTSPEEPGRKLHGYEPMPLAGAPECLQAIAAGAVEARRQRFKIRAFRGRDHRRVAG
jgi:hypothetical protein